MLRLFAFKIFLGLGVGVTQLVEIICFQNISGVRGWALIKLRLFAFKIFLGLGFGVT